MYRFLVIAVIAAALGALLGRASVPACECVQLATRAQVLQIERDAAAAAAALASKQHTQKAKTLQDMNPAGSSACERAQALADFYVNESQR